MKDSQQDLSRFRGGIAHHGSNSKLSYEDREQGFYHQLESFPDELVDQLLNRITPGEFKIFDNVSEQFNVLDSKLVRVSTPYIGVPECIARVLLAGSHPEYGIPNPQAWTREETISYVTVIAHSQSPNKPRAEIVCSADEFKKKDLLFWQLYEDEPMQKRVTAVLNRHTMIHADLENNVV